MTKKSKISTPEWILEGYDSPEEYDKAKGIKKEKKKGKKFKIRECPECGSENVGVVLTGEEGKHTREWECFDCKWMGIDIKEKELSEDEFIEHIEKKEKEEEKSEK